MIKTKINKTEWEALPDSYATLAEAEAYHSCGNDAKWDGASAATRDIHLVRAARLLDQLRWCGIANSKSAQEAKL